MINDRNQSGVDINSITVLINDTDITANLHIQPSGSGYRVEYLPQNIFEYGDIVNVEVQAGDLANPTNYSIFEYAFSVQPFANNTPSIPSNPWPPSGAISHHRYGNLYWACSDPDQWDEVHYEVYMEPANPNPVNLLGETYHSSFGNEWTGRHYIYADQENTTYYWKVVAVDLNGARSEGPVWSFKTERAPQLSGNVSVNNVYPSRLIKYEQNIVTLSESTELLGVNAFKLQRANSEYFDLEWTTSGLMCETISYTSYDQIVKVNIPLVLLPETMEVGVEYSDRVTMSVYDRDETVFLDSGHIESAAIVTATDLTVETPLGVYENCLKLELRVICISDSGTTPTMDTQYTWFLKQGIGIVQEELSLDGMSVYHALRQTNRIAIDGAGCSPLKMSLFLPCNIGDYWAYDQDDAEKIIVYESDESGKWIVDQAKGQKFVTSSNVNQGVLQYEISNYYSRKKLVYNTPKLLFPPQMSIGEAFTQSVSYHVLDLDSGLRLSDNVESVNVYLKAIEDVDTPLGVFRGCLKFELWVRRQTDFTDRYEELVTIWLARGIGVVKELQGIGGGYWTDSEENGWLGERTLVYTELTAASPASIDETTFILSEFYPLLETKSIYKLNPISRPSGLTWDGNSLWSCDKNADEVRRHQFDTNLSVDGWVSTPNYNYYSAPDAMASKNEMIYTSLFSYGDALVSIDSDFIVHNTGGSGYCIGGMTWVDQLMIVGSWWTGRLNFQLPSNLSGLYPDYEIYDFGWGSNIYGMDYYDGYLWVAVYDTVYKCSYDESQVPYYDITPLEYWQFENVIGGIAWDDHGHLWVASLKEGTISECTLPGYEVKKESDSNISGDYWYGWLGSNVVTRSPCSDSGEATITDTQVTLDWVGEEGNPLNKEMTILDKWYDEDGWLNLHLSDGGGSEILQFLSGNNMLKKVTRTPDEDNDLGTTFLVKKAIGATDADIIGEYAYFGHWLGVNWAGSDAEIGVAAFYSDHTFAYFSECTDGEFEFETGIWVFDPATAIIWTDFDGGDIVPLKAGRDGILMNFDIDPIEEDDLGYSLLVKKGFGRTYASVAGRYLYQEFCTDISDQTPLTVWGVLEMSIDGTWTISQTYSDGSSDSSSGFYLIENDGSLYLYDAESQKGYEAVLSENSQFITLAIMGQEGDAGIGFAHRSSDCNGNGIVDIHEIPGDADGDGIVNFLDFAKLAEYWLVDNCGMCGCADMSCDGKVDIDDLTVLTEHWLTEGDYGQDFPDITWVYIDNDPGVSGHEGFNGYMSKYETTNAQFAQYLNAALASGEIMLHTDNVVYAVGDTSYQEPYFSTEAASNYSQITFSNGTFSVRTRDGYDMANHPVVEVSWYGAMAFADFYGWRLPTEWEWQAVADYNGSYTYGCGTTINQSKANYYNGGHANPLGLSSLPYTSPVGYYPAYGYGMCDMAGNVLEWTDSCYYGDCDPGDRVVRGGSCGRSIRGNG